jgi:hypothetical protein
LDPPPPALFRAKLNTMLANFNNPRPSLISNN